MQGASVGMPGKKVVLGTVLQSKWGEPERARCTKSSQQGLLLGLLGELKAKEGCVLACAQLGPARSL